jgi:hypothetical protein
VNTLVKTDSTVGGSFIERFSMDESQNAQALIPTLSRRERVRTAELTVANSGMINKISR